MIGPSWRGVTTGPVPASYRDAVITSESVRAWCLVRGEWLEREDPVMAACDPRGGDVYAAMASLGYEAWCQVGVGDLPAVPLSLALFSREMPPLQFLLQLEGNAGNVVEHVFAETLPDAMELLAKWAPLARIVTRAEPARRYPADGPGLRTDVAVAQEPVSCAMGAPDAHEAMDRLHG
jgi:hypothetical protein